MKSAEKDPIYLGECKVDEYNYIREHFPDVYAGGVDDEGDLVLVCDGDTKEKCVDYLMDALSDLDVAYEIWHEKRYKKMEEKIGKANKDWEMGIITRRNL